MKRRWPLAAVMFAVLLAACADGRPTLQLSPSASADPQIVAFEVFRNPVERGDDLRITWQVNGASRAVLWQMTQSKSGLWYRQGDPISTGSAAGEYRLTVPPDANRTMRFELEATDAIGNSETATSDEIRLVCHPLFFGSPWTVWCPNPPQTTPAAFQAFEGGYMIWRADTGQVYTLLQPGDGWFAFLPTNEAAQVDAPPDRYAPGEHFQRAWASLTERWRSLGWGVAPEQPYSLTLQFSFSPYGYGASDDLYLSWPDGRIAHLYIYLGTWHVSGPAWNFVDSFAAPTVIPSILSTSEVLSQTVRDSAVLVELDAFSGMPNPAWELTEAGVAGLLNRLAALPITPAQSFTEPLGYRGMRVRFTDAVGDIIWRVWRGVAQKTEGDAVTFYADRDRALEHWLLQSGKPHLSSDLFDAIQAEISASLSGSSDPTRPAPTARSPRILRFESNRSEVAPGDNVTFTWISSGGITATLVEPVCCTSIGGNLVRAVPPNGSLTLTMDAPVERDTLTYILSVSDGVASDSKSIRVRLPCPDRYFFTSTHDNLECPSGPPVHSAAVQQIFERGRMIWLESQDKVYVLFGDDLPNAPGAPPDGFLVFDDTWQPGEPESDSTIVPPSGLYQPLRGFGKVWRNWSEVRDGLGWALAPEQAFDGVYQRAWKTCLLQNADGSYRSCSVPNDGFQYLRAADGRVIRLTAFGALGRHSVQQWGFWTP